MNTKKFFMGTAVAVTVFASSSVFANAGSKLSAFDGVPTEAVSQVELDAVSGEADLSMQIAKAALSAVGKAAGVPGFTLKEAGKLAADLGKQLGYTQCVSRGSKTCPKPQYESLLSSVTDAAMKKIAYATATTVKKK